ncbi:toll/interleukin-1 receptor domain-containing protein [Herbiconiux liukaitaii]|uniref:toll/interleukin-1 receptor domain-containing protein n=1 Tax=Herbiconiux liukaitaii TaxID=3342799 RepID=UPI0035B6D908
MGAGESTPGAIAEAIRSFEALVLFWSSAADSSAWVRREFQAGPTRFIEDDSRLLVVVRLDESEVPELVRDLKWIDAADEDADRVANELLGLSAGDRLKAMQRYLDSMEIRVEYFPGFGAMVACPRCGRTVDNIDCKVRWEGDDEYSFLTCKVCGWHYASEM